MSDSDQNDWQSESDFEESDFQSSQELDPESKPSSGGLDREVKNLPYDEALDLSQSQNSVGTDDGMGGMYPSGRGGQKPARLNARPAYMEKDEADPRSAPKQNASNPRGPSGAGGGNETMKNKPFDEAFNISDQDSDESSVETEGSEDKMDPIQARMGAVPKGASSQAVPSFQAAEAKEPRRGAGPQVVGKIGGTNDDNDGDSSESESEDDDSHVTMRPDGAYNPDDYKHLPVSAEIKDLFQYIGRYKPHEVELDSTLKCFIPEYIPAVGEMDAFIKVPAPDGSQDDLGLKMLDEPAAQQSDATVLELQLRAISKKQHGEVAVHSIDHAAKNPGEIDRWIKSIADLHRQKHAVEVQYKKNMPDIDSLMQEWPEELEEMLQKTTLPGPDMDLTLEEYARVICAVMDVPVYDNSVESLHVIFSLYMAFKENPHFAARSKANQAADGTGPDGVDPDSNAQVFTLNEG
uniref:Intraflagellar transport protein 46 homolog n=1 Tax=Octactis speculum TaxID=3111310 RepID=A0A7S2C2T6_9STRA|mmetsp:Transcript_31004/g.41982  ORF Transcript_31004/g.41982 Transcript_31004/m.41982 type:complete len:464 (+) Transcript_31004:44-1435(+)